MAQFVKVASAAEIENGKMKEYKVAGKTIVIANTDGEYLAFDGMCTHAQCSLAGGFLVGYTITCYCHGAQFDISNGEVLAPPATSPIGVYKTRITGEDLLVEI